MNIFKIFQKNKKEYIESLQFFYFLTDARKYLFPRYSWSTNWLILTFFRILDCCYSWNLNQIADYLQFLKDSVFWESRDYYHENLQRFIARELKPSEFINHVLYPIQSDKRKAEDLLKKSFTRRDYNRLSKDYKLLKRYQNRFEFIKKYNQESGRLSKDDYIKSKYLEKAEQLRLNQETDFEDQL